MYFDELNVGMAVDTAPALIKKEKMVAFAKDYDPIPLHTDEEYAKTTPFGGLIAPGIMTFMSVWAKFLELDLFTDAFLAGQSTKVQWSKPVYPEDLLTGTFTVTKLTRRNPKNGLVELTLTACNQKGEPVLSDVTELIIKSKVVG